MNNKKRNFPAKTRKMIAEDYGIHPDTFKNRLKTKEIILPKGLILPNQQKKSTML